MLLKRTYPILIFLFFSIKTQAQYADLGTGNLKNLIWWFNWNGFTISEGASKSFTTNDGLNVTITFSNVSGILMQPSVMNTWPGAVLHDLYDFSDPTIMPALYYLYSPGVPYTSKFTLNISANRNGVPTPFTLVAADSEATLANVEFIDLTTNGSNWNTLDFFRNSSQTTDPVQNCNTQSIVIFDTYDGTQNGIGQNPVMATNAPASGNLTVNV